MTRQRLAALRVFLMVSDAIVTAVVFVAASRLRFGPDWYMVWDVLLPRPRVSLLLYALIAVTTFWLLGMYRLRARWTLRAEIKDLTRALLVLVAVTFSLLYLFKLDRVSRLLLVIFFVLEGVAITVSRSAVRRFFRWQRTRGRASRRTLLVGTGPEARRFVDSMSQFPELGIKPVGFVGPPGAPFDGVARLGAIAELSDVLATHVVDDVVLCLPFRQWGDLDGLIRECETQGKTVRIPATSLERVMSHGRMERVGDLPVLTMSRVPDQVVALAAKRVMDIVGAVVGLVVFSPVMFLVAALILVREGRPVLYSDTRAGRNGRPIRIHKFRTMVRDADNLRAELSSENDRLGPDFKIFDDPRVTRLGAFLRRSSLDELPQFWDVLCGRLSLVGPRAQRLDEVKFYDPRHRVRLVVKPGLTGLWQVTARSDPDFDRRLELDLRYIDEWSVGLDVLIVGRTLREVLSMGGR